jgi:hypothetical protein
MHRRRSRARISFIFGVLMSVSTHISERSYQ